MKRNDDAFADEGNFVSRLQIVQVLKSIGIVGLDHNFCTAVIPDCYPQGDGGHLFGLRRGLPSDDHMDVIERLLRRRGIVVVGLHKFLDADAPVRITGYPDKLAMIQKPAVRQDAANNSLTTG